MDYFKDYQNSVDAINGATFLSEVNTQQFTFYTKGSSLEHAFIEKVVSRLANKLHLPCAPVLLGEEIRSFQNYSSIMLSSLIIPPYSEEIGDCLLSLPDRDIFKFMNSHASALSAMFAFIIYCGAEEQALRASNVISNKSLTGLYFVDFEQYLHTAFDDEYRIISFAKIFNPELYEVTDPDDADLQEWASNFFDADAFNLMQMHIEQLSDQDIVDIVQPTGTSLRKKFEAQTDLFLSLERKTIAHLISRKNNLTEIFNECTPKWLRPLREVLGTPIKDLLPGAKP